MPCGPVGPGIPGSPFSPCSCDRNNHLYMPPDLKLDASFRIKKKLLTVSPFGPAGPGTPAGPTRPFKTC